MLKRLFILFSLIILTTPVFAAQRIVSLAPSVTEILYKLGVEDQIVGVTNYCNYPERAKEKSQMGAYFRPSVEKILMVKPDMVFGMQEGYTLSVKQQLDRFKVPNQFYKVETINDIIDMIRNIAKRLEVDPESTLKPLIDMYSVKPKPVMKGMFLLGESPLYAVGSGSFINEIMACGGITNTLADQAAQYPKINIEYIFQIKPDILILSTMVEGEGYPELKARINKINFTPKMIKINPDIFNRASYRIVEACNVLRKQTGLWIQK